MSALMQAILERRWRQARLLLETGCNVNGRGANGRTPIMEVCFVDNEDKAAGLTRVLLEKGANLDLKDNKGRTALASACLFHRRRLIALFLKSVDFDLNASDREGNTALFHAVTSGDVLIVKELVAKMLYYGVKVDILNKKGETPLIYALKSKKRDIADILVKGKSSMEARDLEYGKSASEWRDELNTTKRKDFQIPSEYFRKCAFRKTESVQRKTNKKVKITRSAKTEGKAETRGSLPRILMNVRPLTAPDRIMVPSFFKPCTPVKKNLEKLYMIYNEQTTDSYRQGYKRIQYNNPKRNQEQEVNASRSRRQSSRSGVTFNQVNDLSIKLQGLYKNSAQRKKVLAYENPELPRIDSDNSLAGRSSSKSSRRGYKIIKNATKTVRQFDNAKFGREISSEGKFGTLP